MNTRTVNSLAVKRDPSVKLESSAERLARLVEAAGARPQSWTLRAPSVRKRTTLISGSTESTAGKPGIVELSLERSADQWQILSWSADNRELCLE